MDNKDVHAASSALPALGFDSIYNFLHKFLESEDQQEHNFNAALAFRRYKSHLWTLGFAPS